MMSNEDNNTTIRAIRAIREDQVRRIVEWLRGRSGAQGGCFTSADDVVDAIEHEFGTDERETKA